MSARRVREEMIQTLLRARVWVDHMAETSGFPVQVEQARYDLDAIDNLVGFLEVPGDGPRPLPWESWLDYILDNFPKSRTGVLKERPAVTWAREELADLRSRMAAEGRGAAMPGEGGAHG